MQMKRMQSSPPPPFKQPPKRDFGDFSDEYAGKLVTVKLFDGSLIAGKIVEVRKFFIKILQAGNNETLYINKAYIVAIY